MATPNMEALAAQLAGLNTSLADLRAQLGMDGRLIDGSDIDTGFTLLSGYLVFFMQAGFAMLCAGSVRAKNAKNIILLNLLDACFGCLAWYLLGWAFAYGDPAVDNATGEYPSRGNPFIGNRYFVQAGLDRSAFVTWFFQFTFASTSATIVSGAVAERCKFECYVFYNLFIVAFVYPVVAHWVWSPWGWLSAGRTAQTASSGYVLFANSGVYDFAGDGPVHMVGGFASLAAAWVLGPRLGRFDAAGMPVDIPGHNASLTLLGVFLLWFGWYGFNPGSTNALLGNRAQISAAIAINTTISASAATVSTMVIAMLHTYLSLGVVVWDLIIAGNGTLAGLVSITGPCAFVPTWAALVIGLLGGAIYYGCSRVLLYKMKIDDPLDAVAVHAGGSVWGMLAGAAFSQSSLVQAWFGPYPGSDPVADPGSAVREYGFIMGGGGNLLGAHLVYIVVIAAWTLGLMTPFFVLLNRLGLMRVSPEVESAGLDVSHHGGSAYPHYEDARMKLSNGKEVVTIDMMHEMMSDALESMERRLMPVRLLAEAAAKSGSTHGGANGGSAHGRGGSLPTSKEGSYTGGGAKVNRLRPLSEGEPMGGGTAPASRYNGELELAGSQHSQHSNPSRSRHSNPSTGRTLSALRRQVQAAYTADSRHGPSGAPSSPPVASGSSRNSGESARGSSPRGGALAALQAAGGAQAAEAAQPDLEAGQASGAQR